MHSVHIQFCWMPPGNMAAIAEPPAPAHSLLPACMQQLDQTMAPAPGYSSRSNLGSLLTRLAADRLRRGRRHADADLRTSSETGPVSMLGSQLSDARMRQLGSAATKAVPKLVRRRARPAVRVGAATRRRIERLRCTQWALQPIIMGHGRTNIIRIHAPGPC